MSASAVPSQLEIYEVRGVVDDGGRQNEEMGIVSYAVTGKGPVLKVCVETFLPFRLTVLHSEHIKFLPFMLKYYALPSSRETYEVVLLLRFRSVVEWELPSELLFECTVAPSKVPPSVCHSSVVVLIEECYRLCREGILVVLVTVRAGHEVGVSIFIISEERHVAIAKQHFIP